MINGNKKMIRPSQRHKFKISFSKRLLFFGRNSAIHGLGHLFREDAPFFTRLFWLLILLACSGCLYILLVPVVARGAEVNYTPDTLYLPWTTTFPAVTVCEEYEPKEAQRKLAAFYPSLMNSSSFDYKRHIAALTFAKGVCTPKLCFPCGEVSPNGIVVPCDFPWREAIEKVRKPCKDIISECRLNGIEFSCCQRFHAVDSEYGTCFSFNSLQSSNKESLFTMNRTTGPALLSFRLLSETQISVHSTEELSTNDLDDKLKFNVRLGENHYEYTFSMVDIVNDELLDDRIAVRGCRFKHEIPKKPFHNYSVYSYGACKLAERIKRAYGQCRCVHPVRSLSYKNLYCNFTGLSCLVNYQNRLPNINQDDDNEEDNCLPSCDESEINTINLLRARYIDQPGTGFLVKINMASLPSLRYQRNLLRNNLDLVVSVGGMVGLFFSASILSIVEIMYLLLRSP